jgi:hypothetical protein
LLFGILNLKRKNKMVTVSTKYNPIILNNDVLISSEDAYSYADGKHTRVGNVLRGFGKAIKWVGGEIVKAERWVVKESKVVAKGVIVSEKKILSKANKLIHHKEKSGHATDDISTANNTTNYFQTNDSGLAKMKDVFTEPLPKISKEQAAKMNKKHVANVDGQNYDASKANGKPIVASTDQDGTKVVGVEYTPDEVTAEKDNNGNYQYYTNKDADEGTGMSTTTKILIGVGGVVFLGILTWLAVRKKK